MNVKNKSIVRYVAATLLMPAILASTGCSWFQGLEIDPTRDWTPQKLYSEAKEAMHESNWKTAKEYYTKLEARYPFGSYAQQAQIDLAYIYFKDGEPDASIQQIDRFLRAYPNHPNSDYALYLKALATLNEKEGFFWSMVGQDISERDPKASREAFDIYKELVMRFPDSRYAPEARRRLHELVNAQANHQLNTARYYYDRKAYVAAINRAKVILTDFQRTTASDGAMALIADCYHELGLLDLEKDMRRVIELNKGRAPATKHR